MSTEPSAADWAKNAKYGILIPKGKVITSVEGIKGMTCDKYYETLGVRATVPKPR